MLLALEVRAMTAWRLVKQRAAQARHDDRGEIPAQVVWLAALVVIALAVAAVVSAKTNTKANSINLDQ